jgi:hypothetical protein
LSDNKEDLELEALQRELDDAFATTRPRRGFEDELWLRMQARRPLWTRLREAVGSWGALFREAPAIPLGAVAVVLVVVIGASILVNSGLRLSTTHNSSTAGVAQAPDMALGGEFGKLPTPAFHPGVYPAPAAYGPSASYATFEQSNLYFGAASMRWTGQLPLQTAQAPVYRYTEPGVTTADQFAASVGASSDKQVRSGSGFPATYRGQSFMLTVQPTEPQLPLEPYFTLAPTAPVSANGTDPQVAATTFLGQYTLVPSWPSSVTVQQSGGHVIVQYSRAFQLPGGGVVYLVNWVGQRYGASVDINEGGIDAASGPLPLNLDATNYRLISNDQAVQMALASAPASTQAIQPTPAVDLKTVELVYALAFARGQGYYEPAYLFSGTFQYNGQTYTKRVLVPLVDPSLRS